MYCMLEVSWRNRPTVSEILESNWVQGIQVCSASQTHADGF